MHLIPNYPPPGGLYVFPTNDTTLTSETEEGLYDLVTKYRIENRLTPTARAEVEKEINDYYCAKYPHFCRPEPGEFNRIQVGEDRRQIDKSIADRAIEWNAYWLDRMEHKPKCRFPLVSMEEAERRAIACANCPANKHGVTACASCGAEIGKVAMAVVGNRHTVEDRLGFCDVFGHHTKAAVHLMLSDQRIDETPKDNIPTNCWKKDT